MKSGYWVICVDRKTGRTETRKVLDHDDAWKIACELETPTRYTTVVDQRTLRVRTRR